MIPAHQKLGLCIKAKIYIFANQDEHNSQIV